jgi:hypothetical protein
MFFRLFSLGNARVSALVIGITFHGRITAREYVGRLSNQVHPMIQTFFRKTTKSPFTQLELFSHGSLA